VLDLQRHLLPRLVHSELAEIESFPDGHANAAFVSTLREYEAKLSSDSDLPADNLATNITFEYEHVFQHNGLALRCPNLGRCEAGPGHAVNQTEPSVSVEIVALLRGNARYDDPNFPNRNYRWFDVMLVRRGSTANPTTSGSCFGVISVPAKLCRPTHDQYCFIDPANVPCSCSFIPMYQVSQEGGLSGSSSRHVINRCV
jgi:hypothetical protein